MKTLSMLVLDVDGTLTSGAITYSSNDESKTFNVKDGLILRSLPRLGIRIVFLTGRYSEAVERRASELYATVIQGVEDKKVALLETLSRHDNSSETVAYIGDDLNDYCAMKLCGFKAAPSDAVSEIKAICDYVSPFPGGHGAVRDICEHLLREVGKYDEFLILHGIEEF